MPNATALVSALRAGVTGEISDTFKSRLYEESAMRELLFKFIPTKKGEARQKLFSFKSSTPFPSLQKYGESRTYKGLKDYAFTMKLYNYELTITWDKYEEIDDQLGDVRTQASSAVNRFFEMQEVLYTEYLDGVKNLNPALELAWTGTSLFNTVDGDGNDLFGASGGNIITGSGTSVEAILHDLASVKNRAMKMTDLIAGKPLFRNSEVTFDKFHVMHPVDLNDSFFKASEAKMLRTNLSNNTSESNVYQGKFTAEANQYLIDQNDWFVVIEHPVWKPFLLRGPDNVETFMADQSNSDRARDNNELGMYMNVRTGVVPYMQNVIYKVSNT